MHYDSNNVFWRILHGREHCVPLAESEYAIAIMDRMPQSRGHLLVIPRERATVIDELSEEQCAETMRLVYRLAKAVKSALHPDGIFIAQYNGVSAGQTVGHVHFHVIPRWDAVPLKEHGRILVPEDQLIAIAQKITAELHR